MSTLPPPPSPPLTVGLISLGCAKNLVDSQIMAGQLLGEGIVLAAEPEKADIILVNTCAFIEAAREESIDAILSACECRQRGPCRGVIVAGCLSQRYCRDLAASLPEVDAFVGLDELDRIDIIIRRVAHGERDIVDVSAQSRRLHEPTMAGLSLTGGPYAYLKIAEGCHHGCAFCAIPAIRGRFRSRPLAAIVREAEALLEAGFRELNLVSQDTTAYGRDLGNSEDLPALLRALGKLGGTFWIRLLYGYPTGVTDALLDAMGETPQACRYFDIPIQHSHPEILRAMRRGHTAAAVRTLPERLRAVFPDATLRTTCLLGFPGETETHVRHLLDYVAAAAFDHLGAFVFSPEDGTPAAGLRPRPRRATAEKRLERVMLLQQAIVRRRRSALRTGADVALLEKPGSRPGLWLARTPRQAADVDGLTRVSGLPSSAAAGDIVPVTYTGGRGYDLSARFVVG